MDEQQTASTVERKADPSDGRLPTPEQVTAFLRSLSPWEQLQLGAALIVTGGQLR